MELKIKIDFARGEENEFGRLIVFGIEKLVSYADAIHKGQKQTNQSLLLLTNKFANFMATTNEKLDNIQADLNTANDAIDNQAAAITAGLSSLDGISADVDYLRKQAQDAGVDGARLDELSATATRIKDKAAAATSALQAFQTKAADLDALTPAEPTTPTEPTEPTEPGTPTEPNPPTEPTEPGTPVEPSPSEGTPAEPGAPSITIPGFNP